MTQAKRHMNKQGKLKRKMPQYSESKVKVIKSLDSESIRLTSLRMDHQALNNWPDIVLSGSSC